jgi:hypothetical protein
MLLSHQVVQMEFNDLKCVLTVNYRAMQYWETLIDMPEITRDNIMSKELAYKTDEEYMSHSSKISDNLKNIKPSILREAMAKADGFQTARSYRTALKNQVRKNKSFDSVYLKDEYLYFRMTTPFNDDELVMGIESVNDYIESLLIGEAYGIQEPGYKSSSTDFEGYREVYGYINIEDVSNDDNVKSAISHFIGNCDEKTPVLLLANSAIDYARRYVGNLALTGPDHNIDAWAGELPFDIETMKKGLPISAIRFFTKAVESELKGSKISDGSEIELLAINKVWSCVVNHAIQYFLKKCFSITGKDKFLTYKEIHSCDDIVGPAIFEGFVCEMVLHKF